MSTFQSLLDDAYQALLATSSTPRIDAELLLKHASNKSLAWLITHATKTVDKQTLKNFYALLEKRQLGEPIAYLLGSRQFWTLDLIVTPDVLIPRPDTETLVEQTLKLIPDDNPSNILDLGTGSGAIALSIAKERPQGNIIATDKSSKALAIAKQNAARNQIQNIQFVESDWFNALANQNFDFIVCNPPYIAENDEHLKQGDVRFEPLGALISGRDGLNDIRTLCAQSPKYLTTNGYLILEHGYNQQSGVQALLKQNSFGHIQTFADLNQLPRVTMGKLNT